MHGASQKNVRSRIKKNHCREPASQAPVTALNQPFPHPQNTQTTSYSRHKKGQVQAEFKLSEIKSLPPELITLLTGSPNGVSYTLA